MRRGISCTAICCIGLFVSSTAEAQVTRLTKLNFTEPAPLRDPEPDPYRAMQVAYQPGEPADYAPTLSTSPLGTGTSTTAAPGSSTVGGQVVAPAPGAALPSTTIITPSAPGTCGGCGAPPATVQYAPVPAVGSTLYTAPVVTYTPAPVVVQQYVPAAPATQTVVGATGTAPIVRAGLPPLLPVAPSRRAVFVSDGLLGQPVVYVPGQPIRNFLRYLTP